jgi:hypothetical protein
LTTLSPPALLGDLLLVWLCHKATGSWGESLHDHSMTALYIWIFTSKWIKLLGHYLRYPVDVLLLPVSILFGYFHGAIKMYAVMTLNVVCIQSHLLPLLRLLSLLLVFPILISYLRVQCMCIQAQPLLSPVFSSFTYENPASQRFDLDFFFLQPVTHYCSVRTFPFFLRFFYLDFSFDMVAFYFSSPRAALTFLSRPHGVAVTALTIMTPSV